MGTTDDNIAPGGSDQPAPVATSRRAFLGQASAVVLGAALPAGRVIAKDDLNSADGCTWAILSDMHLHRDTAKTVRTQNMADNLRAIVPQVVAFGPQRILFNGDMAFASGDDEDYACFGNLISPLNSTNARLHYTLGNHDHRERFMGWLGSGGGELAGSSWVSAFAAGGVHWLLLDSLRRVNGWSGELGVAQLDWLRTRLDGLADAPVVICVHHQPEQGFDGLRDAPALLDVVRPRHQVKALFHGHRHVWGHSQVDGLHVIGLPATGYWFNPIHRLGWVAGRVSTTGLALEFRSVSGERLQSADLRWR